MLYSVAGEEYRRNGMYHCMSLVAWINAVSFYSSYYDDILLAFFKKIASKVLLLVQVLSHFHIWTRHWSLLNILSKYIKHCHSSMAEAWFRTSSFLNFFISQMDPVKDLFKMQLLYINVNKNVIYIVKKIQQHIVVFCVAAGLLTSIYQLTA